MALFSQCEEVLPKIDINSLLDAVVIENNNTSFEQYLQIIRTEHHDAFSYFTSNQAQWYVPPSLQQKVGSDGLLLPYHGNTVVFPLSNATLKILKNIQNDMRSSADFFASALSEEHFHLTLHDLFHSDNLNSVTREINESGQEIVKIFNGIKEMITVNPSIRYIDLVPSKIIPSVNTSIIIGYLPKTERDYLIIFNIYKLFDKIKKLPYFFRPHITMDYFTPRGLDRQQLETLRELLITANQYVLPEIKLDLMELSYQFFSSMDKYITVIKVNNN